MRNGRHPSRWFVTRLSLAMVAVVIQALLPFVIAADIIVADAPPICSIASADNRDHHRPDHHRDSGGTCPICAALAAAAAIATPTTPIIPPPRFAGTMVSIAVARVGPDLDLPTSYRSRAPPLA
jgi:hypothetical protein